MTMSSISMPCSRLIATTPQAASSGRVCACVMAQVAANNVRQNWHLATRSGRSLQTNVIKPSDSLASITSLFPDITLGRPPFHKAPILLDIAEGSGEGCHWHQQGSEHLKASLRGCAISARPTAGSESRQKKQEEFGGWSTHANLLPREWYGTSQGRDIKVSSSKKAATSVSKTAFGKADALWYSNRFLEEVYGAQIENGRALVHLGDDKVFGTRSMWSKLKDFCLTSRYADHPFVWRFCELACIETDADEKKRRNRQSLMGTVQALIECLSPGSEILKGTEKVSGFTRESQVYRTAYYIDPATPKGLVNAMEKKRKATNDAETGSKRTRKGMKS